MDFDSSVTVDTQETGHPNGIHEPSPHYGEDAISNCVNGAEGLTDNLANVSISEGTATNTSVTGEVREESNVHLRTDVQAGSKEEEVKGAGNSKQVRSLKGPTKSKNEKLANPRVGSATQVKKEKDGKVSQAPSAVSNGLKSKSFNERQMVASKQHSGKSDATSSEGQMEKIKVKAPKKGPALKAEGDGQASTSPTADDAKLHKTGNLPNYGFSFKCDERAEKRKEFYTKLEEKIHAKEVEKNTIQAKSKESQEAEIKMLRKSLTFKATPMPVFYKEPAPPKVELKEDTHHKTEISQIRPKKTPSAESEETNGQSIKPGRLSLDPKVSTVAKGPLPAQSKKPQRKSLPKLPSQKTILPLATTNVDKTASSEVPNEENTAHMNENEITSLEQEQEIIPEATGGEEQVVSEQAQTIASSINP